MLIEAQNSEPAITLLQPENVACQEIKAGCFKSIIKNEVSQFFKENPADRNKVNKDEMIYLVSRYAYGLPSIDPICASKKIKSIESVYLEAGLSNEALPSSLLTP